ncbi:MAG TPA: TIM barrel protein, partial [Candidatus Thermoplasmatota archaeon]|nr:TIM barrel protein [Candidatus Thermoplasmatota archaeon]
MRLGVKTHWRDAAAMAALARRHGARVLEYQMLPGDLERHARDAFEAFLPLRGEFELRVHQPEAFWRDGRLHRLDPASGDKALRDASAQALGEMARHAMELRAKALIVHGGGIYRPGQRPGTPEALRASLEDVPRHVPLLLENMPWFYASRSEGWDDGRAPAFTLAAEGLAPFAPLVDGFVLDVSHAYLAVEEGDRKNVLELAAALGPRVRHVHASGGRARVGSRGEGTPFGDSDYGLDLVREALAFLPDDIVVVPEIMDGHQDGG